MSQAAEHPDDEQEMDEELRRINASIVAAIRARRQELGIDLIRLAAALGVGREEAEALECGERLLFADEIPAICSLLSIYPDDLLPSRETPRLVSGRRPKTT